MSLIAQAKADIAQITSNTDEFGVTIILYNTSDEAVTIAGLHSKIHLAVDTDGNPVSAKQAHISFSESVVNAAGVSIRNSNGEVDLKDYKVDVKDSTGLVKRYKISRWMPDETTGLISCYLEDYE